MKLLKYWIPASLKDQSQFFHHSRGKMCPRYSSFCQCVTVSSADRVTDRLLVSVAGCRRAPLSHFRPGFSPFFPVTQIVMWRWNAEAFFPSFSFPVTHPLLSRQAFHPFIHSSQLVPTLHTAIFLPEINPLWFWRSFFFSCCTCRWGRKRGSLSVSPSFSLAPLIFYFLLWNVFCKILIIWAILEWGRQFVGRFVILRKALREGEAYVHSVHSVCVHHFALIG